MSELDLWERKNEYYHNIKLGGEIGELRTSVNTQTNAFIRAQLKSTNSIIVSQEKIAELTNSGFKELSYKMSEVSSGISDLGAAFEWGLSHVLWQLEKNSNYLKNIENGIWSPFDAQARNRKVQADEAFGFGWIEEAEEYYLESEKIVKFDYSVHMSLGIIYFQHKNNREKALSYFEKAFKYSKPKSSYHASLALIHIAKIYFDIGKITEAIKKTEEAIELTPNLIIAYYNNAQYNAQIKQSDISLKSLRTAIKYDIHYCEIALADKLFEPIKEEVIIFFKNLRKIERQKSKNSLKQIEDQYLEFLPRITLLCKNFPSHTNLNTKKIELKIIQIKDQINRNSYFDFLELNNIILPKLKEKTDNLILSFKKVVYKFEDDINYNINYENTAHSDRELDLWDKRKWILMHGSFIVPILASLLFFEGWDKLWVFLFFIPIVSQFLSVIYVLLLFIDSQKLIEGNFIASGEFIVAITIAIFLIIFILLYVYNRFELKNIAKSKIKRQTSKLKKFKSIKSKLVKKHQLIERQLTAK